MKAAFLIIFTAFVAGMICGLALAGAMHKWVNDFADRCEGLDPNRERPC